eukprot:PITA_14049
MDRRYSSNTIWSRLLRGEENDEQVNQILAQFQDESALQLNLDSHRSTKALHSPQNSDVGGFDSVGLDNELARRYSNLKAPLAKPQLEKILGQELALRLAALRSSSSAKNIVSSESQSLVEPQESQGIDSRETTIGTQKEKIGDSGETCFVKQIEIDSKEEQVQKLLASVQYSIKLERSRVLGISSSSGQFNDVGEEHVDDEEIILESEVENIVEWAKDAARLGFDDSEEEEDDDDNYEDVNYEDESDHSEKQSVGTRKAKK